MILGCHSLQLRVNAVVVLSCVLLVTSALTLPGATSVSGESWQ